MTEHTRSSLRKPLDSERLLEALQSELRARQRKGDRADPALRQRRLEGALRDVELARVVSAHWPLKATSLPTRALALLRKVTRQCLRWYINPIVEQQNAYNSDAARMLRLLVESCIDLNRQLATMRQTTPVASTIPQASTLPPANAAHATLQTLVRERAVHEPPAAFLDLQLPPQHRQLRMHEAITAHWPLNGTTLVGRAMALAQKVMRRFLRWYINPIVEQQNAANTALSAALTACMRLDGEYQGQIAAKRASSMSEPAPPSS